MQKIQLTPCVLCADSHDTYDFFKEVGADLFIIEFEFRVKHVDIDGNEHVEATDKQLELMSVGHYQDGGIALVLNGQMLYSFGKMCFITSYCPIEIEK